MPPPLGEEEGGGLLLNKKLVEYFKVHELKSTKNKSYKLWVKLLEKIKNKDHLDINLRDECIELSKKIN